jgi:hypothetical protein
MQTNILQEGRASMELGISCGTLITLNGCESGLMDGIFVFDLYGKDGKKWTIQYSEEKSVAYAYRMIEPAKALSFRLSDTDTTSIVRLVNNQKDSIVSKMRGVVSKELASRSSNYFCLMDRLSQGSYVSFWGDGTDNRVEAIVANISHPEKVLLRDYTLENK